jgi:hypothetical protein
LINYYAAIETIFAFNPQMERQILLQNEMRQRGLATQIAFSREMFMWWGTFYAVVTTGAILGQVNV